MYVYVGEEHLPVSTHVYTVKYNLLQCVDLYTDEDFSKGYLSPVNIIRMYAYVRPVQRTHGHTDTHMRAHAENG